MTSLLSLTMFGWGNRNVKFAQCLVPFCGQGGPTVGVCHTANRVNVWAVWGWGGHLIRPLMNDSDFMFVLQAKKRWMVSDDPSASKVTQRKAPPETEISKVS